MATNNPKFSPLAEYTERQLLAMILVELKILNIRIDEDAQSLSDLETLRLELLNHNDIVSGDAA